MQLNSLVPLHRTIVYLLKDNVKFHIDLTKKINSLLKSASNLAKDVDRILFCHPDITSHSKIGWKDKSKEDDYFTSRDNLQDHLEGLT